MIKCVIWDIDNTLLDGIYLEAADQLPDADRELAGVARELASRGILQALASRNPPEAADYVQAVTGLEFAAAECGWESKAESIERIAAELQLGQDAMAFVDDDMLERAEVSASLPDVVVLTPEEAADAPNWPQFNPEVITAESRHRGEMYAARRRRESAAQEFGGSREEFLRKAGTRITIGRASQQHVPRLHELSVRTHQLNSAGEPWTQDELARLVESGEHVVPGVMLADDFGDDGLVGAAVMQTHPAGAYQVPLVMMSCRALGRGALDALLAWLCDAAAVAGAAEIQVPCLVTQRNVPMRLALAAAGLRAEPAEVAPDGRAIFSRRLTAQLPELPAYVEVRDRL